MNPVFKNDLGLNISLSEYVRYCCNSQQIPKAILKAKAQGGLLEALVNFAELTGNLEPACATRPGVCDPVIVIDKDVFVPRADIDQENDCLITSPPFSVLSICAPMNKALVIEILRVTAANLTAQVDGQIVFQNVNLGSVGGWCLPFEPEGGPGQLVNVEHIILPPGAGFKLSVVNTNPYSEAVFHVHARMWSCC